MRFTLPLIFCCLCSLLAFAKDAVRIGPEPRWLYKTNPALQKVPNSRDISDGYYLNLFDEQCNLPEKTTYTHFIKQIVNESGIQNASEVSVTFSPQFQELVFHKIVIIRENEVINQALPERIKVVQEETDASDFQYNGLKRAFVTLKDVRKGDRIEVAYSLTGFNPVFGNRYTDQFYFIQATAICNYYKTIISTSERPLVVHTINNAQAPQEQKAGVNIIYHWNNPPLKNWESQAHVPSWFNNYPTVAVSEYKSWKEVVDWGMGLMHQYQYPLPAGLEQKIAGWKAETGNDKDAFANRVIQFVQDDIRYLGLEIGPGTHQPRSPAEVYTHRFGDCKDKSLLLAVILRENGIPAYVALTSSDIREKLAETMPSPGEFNHAIVAMERSKDQYVFIDPTIPAQKGALVNHYIPAYGYALVLKEQEQQLRQVDLGSQKSYSITEVLDVHYNDTSRFSVTTTYGGGAADNIRSSFAESSAREVEKNYQKYYASLFDGIQLNAPVEMKDDPSPLNDKVDVNESYVIPNIWSKDEKGKQFFYITTKVLTEHLVSPSSMAANVPMALAYPVTVNYHLQIKMPEEWPVRMTALHIKNDSYQFDFVPKVSGDEINLQYFFKTFKDHIPASAMAQYKADYKNIADRMYFQLYKNGVAPNSSDNGQPAPVSIFWPGVGLAVLLGILFWFIFKKLNAREEDVPYAAGSGYPLGGWVIVLGITIGVGLLVLLLGMFKSKYFSHTTWLLLGSLGGTWLQVLWLIEFLIDLFNFAALCALLYWYLNRRDIFPKMFTWFCGIRISISFVLLAIYYTSTLPAELDQVKTSQASQFFRAFVYSLIWVSYVCRSERVKATFLEPYRQQKTAITDNQSLENEQQEQPFSDMQNMDTPQ